MSEPQTITIDHVRALLDASTGEATLSLIEGRVEVIEAAQATKDAYRGALEVISRNDLEDRLSEDPSDTDLATQAEALSAAVQHLGG